MGLLRDLDRIFGRFAGKIVAAKVTETRFGNLLFRACTPEKDDDVLAGLAQEAKRQGLSLRLNFPGVWNDDVSVDITRVNARLEEVSPGRFRVADFAQG